MRGRRHTTTVSRHSFVKKIVNKIVKRDVNKSVGQQRDVKKSVASSTHSHGLLHGVFHAVFHDSLHAVVRISRWSSRGSAVRAVSLYERPDRGRESGGVVFMHDVGCVRDLDALCVR